MREYCPVCFNTTSENICPYCGTDIQTLRRMRDLESAERNRLESLQEVLRVYRTFNRPQAVERLLSQLADHSLKVGRWREARHYLEQLLAQSEPGASPALMAVAKRKLGGLLGRFGEMPLALHLLSHAEQEGDALAVIERLRLEIDAYAKKDVLRIIGQLEKKSNLTLLERVWRLEVIARFGSLISEEKFKETVDAAADDSYAHAVAQRAFGIWQMNKGSFESAIVYLRQAINLFQEHDPYEVARTQVDLARTHLLKEVGSSSPEDSEAAIGNAQIQLSSAITTFRKLKTIAADANATELMQVLAIGRRIPPLKRDATSSPVALIWLDLHGEWSPETWSQVIETAHRQGGLVQRMLGGLVVLFGGAQHHDDMRIVIETAMAMYDLMMHHQTHFKYSAQSKFSMVCSMGMLPQYDVNVMHTLQNLPQTRLFQETRAQAVHLKPGVVAVNEMLYLDMQVDFVFAPLPADAEKPGAKQWWQLTLPQHVVPNTGSLRRHHLLQYDTVLQNIDQVMTRIKSSGGLVAITGKPGAGKTRILDLLSREVQGSTQAWLIHLRGRTAARHQPFSAIKHWLGAELPQSTIAPRERRLTQIATFRRSILGLMTSKPLLVVVDDLHLLDSGSLETLQAILPLLGDRHLIMLVAARDPSDDDAENRVKWQSIIDTARRGLPDRSVHVRLPDDLAYRPRKLPEDLMDFHVLACAAVLGDQFSALALRQMSWASDLEHRLIQLKAAEFIKPTGKSQIWEFSSTAERDHIYNTLSPDYRAMLHWYARQSLKVLGLPNEHHIHFAGLPEPAMKVNMRAAQQALEMESPIEALIHFDRALEHFEGEGTPVDLMLARAATLMTLGEWGAAMEEIARVEATPGLSLRDEINILIYQGELNYRVGEVAMLFRLYEQAAAKLRELPPEETDPSEQISIMYAQALARFRRGEMEMARSMTGGALLIAQQSGYAHEMAHLWELLARIHDERGETGQAQQGIEKAISIYQEAKYHWQLLEPLHLSGMLMMREGDLDTARKRLSDALDLAESTGEKSMAIRLHNDLAQIALYRGEFDDMINHQEAALMVARFSENLSDTVYAAAGLIEGLILQDKLIDAMKFTMQAVMQAEHVGQELESGIAQLALGRVSLALNRLDEADAALQAARKLLGVECETRFKLLLEMSVMEIAHRRKDAAAFEAVWVAARDLLSQNENEFIRGRIGFLAAQYHVAGEGWNSAARELEVASRIFEKIGASYWRGKARDMFNEVLPKASGYKRTTQTNLRSSFKG